MTTPLDASNIVRRLWVGGQPPLDRDLPEFDVLVLCAEEIQPERLGFARKIVRVPLPDATLSTDELRRALAGGRAIAQALTSGQRVLVTCHDGWNRSALVAGLGLGLVTRFPSSQIITMMRVRRSPNALSNKHFCEVLYRFIGDRRRERTLP